jgi:hypothetical protein
VSLPDARRQYNLNIPPASALCLCNAAIKSNTDTPSVMMPHSQGSGEYPKRLDSSSCPPELYPLFKRWVDMVPYIKGLQRDHKTDFERIMCNKSPITVTPCPPPYFTSQDHSNSVSFYMLADDLRGVASDIVHCLYRQPEYSHAPATPNMGPNTTSPAWLAPSLAPSPTSYTAPPAPPSFSYPERPYQSLKAQWNPIHAQAQHASQPNILSPLSSIQSSPTYMAAPSPMTSQNPMNTPVGFVGGSSLGGPVATTTPNLYFPTSEQYSNLAPPAIHSQFIYNTTPMPASSYLPASNTTEVIGSRMVRRFDLVLPYFSYLSHDSQP